MGKRLLLLIQLLLIIGFTGCRKDFDFNKVKIPEWQADLALPLVRDSITFISGLESTDLEKNFSIDESGNISILFYYNTDAFNLSTSDLLQLPAFPLDFVHTFSQAEQQIISIQDYNLPPQTFTVNMTADQPGVRLDKLMIKSGKIFITTENSFSNAGNFSISFPEATKNGDIFSVSIDPISTGYNAQTIDLKGVQLDLAGNPGKMSAVLNGIMKKSNRPQAGDNFHMNITFTIDTIALFEGYLGNRTFDFDEEYIRINIFNNAFALGTLYFEDPSVNVTMINSIGVPARITMQEIKAVNLQSDVTFDLTSHLGPYAVFDVASPTISSPQPSLTYMEYNNTNTGNSINPLLNIKPDRVYFKLKTEINPGSMTNNFFRDTSSLRADLRVKFPLYGYFDRLTVQDTFDFNLAEQQNVDHVYLRTAITNGLPLMARVQVYFVDEHYTKIDSLTGADNILIKEAPVDPATHLPYPGEYGVKDTIFMLDHDRMVKLHDAKRMLVKAVMNSTGDGTELVKIKADQMLKLDFSAMLKMNMDLNK